MMRYEKMPIENTEGSLSHSIAPILFTSKEVSLKVMMLLQCAGIRSRLAARPFARFTINQLSVPQAAASSRSLHTDKNEATSQTLVDDRGFLQFNTLHEMTRNATLLYSKNPLFGTFTSKIGDFHWTSYADFGSDVRQCASLLKDLGVKPYSKVGIISNNRREWPIIAAATYSLNATFCPMYESQLPKDWSHILNDSESTTLFCATEDIYLKVMKEVMPNTPLLTEVLCLDAAKHEPNSFRGAMSRMEGIDVSTIEPTPDDLANLIYTSGTTGLPKGVELIHSNQVSNIKAARDMVVDQSDFIQSTDRSLSFLPFAHSYGQTCELWCLISQGASLGISRGIPHILEDLQLVQPSVLFSVPTLYKRVHDGVINLMNNESSVKQGLMRAALRIGKANAAHKNGIIGSDGTKAPPLGLVDKLKFKLLDEVVLAKIRGRFGNNLRVGFVAGAACPREIVDFMDSIGISVCEGYGLTETSPIISLNVLGRRKAGSVGQILDGVQVWVVDPDGNPVECGKEGEICCSGPNVMRGYHNNLVATKEVITISPDGKQMFHTGDLGKLGEDGFLHVTGRLKELYKLENGKYVCPTPIEEAISMSRYISQVVVCGANRPYNIAVIAPDWAAIRSEVGFADLDVSEEELVNDDRVRGLIAAEIKLHCYKVKRYEVPQNFLIVSPFTASNNMLTPKMSIRRHVVIKTYEDMIADLYNGNIHEGFQFDEPKAA